MHSRCSTVHELGWAYQSPSTSAMARQRASRSTVAGQLRLPADKLDHLRSLLQEWGDNKACQ